MSKYVKTKRKLPPETAFSALELIRRLPNSEDVLLHTFRKIIDRPVDAVQQIPSGINALQQIPSQKIDPAAADFLALAILNAAAVWKLAEVVEDPSRGRIWRLPEHFLVEGAESDRRRGMQWCHAYFRRAANFGIVRLPVPQLCATCGAPRARPRHPRWWEPLVWTPTCGACALALRTGPKSAISRLADERAARELRRSGRERVPVERRVVAGVRFRSRWEYDFARFLELRGCAWRYEPEVFELYLPFEVDGARRAFHTPDFDVWTPLGRCYVELHRLATPHPGDERKLAKLMVAYREIPVKTGLPLVVLGERDVAAMQRALSRELKESRLRDRL